jgi:spermidine synthase
VETVSSGVAELIRDADRPEGVTLLLDGAPQSHVDLGDPTHLEFEYVRRMAAAIDAAAPAGQPLRTLHLGGGALTLPRYVAATRPGSAQRVVEADAGLVELVRRELPWDRRAGLKMRIGDAREAVTAAAAANYDVVVCDVFAGSQTPAHLTTVEFVLQVARVLRPDGRYLANVADGPPLRYARAQVATIGAVFPSTILLADAAVLRGRRYGNLVVVAGRGTLPVAELTRRSAGDWFPGRVWHGAELARFAGDVAPVTDATAVPSPAPPPDLFGRRR